MTPGVGDHVFIGADAMLLGPIQIGDHAKVGANVGMADQRLHLAMFGRK